MKKILLIGALLFSTSAFAQGFGYNNGNQYNSFGSSVNGFNSRTGSTWNTNYGSGGNMNGTDKRGNSWDYNRNTGEYNNYGTGKRCFGKGLNRVCN